MRKIKNILCVLIFITLFCPFFVQADSYNDDWQGIIAENIYPWGSRLWEPWERVTPKKKLTIGISVPSLSSPYFVNQVYGYLTEAEAAGVGVTVLAANGYEDLQGQISQIENLVQKGVDALIVAPISAEGLAAITEEVVDNGTPVYFIGEAAITDKLAGYVCENDFDFGYKATDWLCKKLDGKGKIAILPGPAGSTYTEAINKGAHYALKNYPDIKLVAEKWGDAEDPAVGQSVAENILNAHPDLDGFFVVEAQAHGVANALKEAKLTEKVHLAIAYPFQETLPYIQDGSIDYGVTGHSLTNARILINMVVRNHNKENAVPKYVWTPGLEILQDNVDTFPKSHVWAPEGWKPPSSMVLKAK
ncbi:MAG: substrate-binding domain-containing protein [Desulfobacterales bacterium]|nr:substrate-binding domain-containing protein [Desulfobacterales bacterium]